jgi:hypothetical protein
MVCVLFAPIFNIHFLEPAVYSEFRLLSWFNICVCLAGWQFSVELSEKIGEVFIKNTLFPIWTEQSDFYCFDQERICKTRRWDLAEWLERCASIAKITSSNPSSGSELTFVLICCWLREVVVHERSLSLPVCRVTRVTHSALSA